MRLASVLITLFLVMAAGAQDVEWVRTYKKCAQIDVYSGLRAQSAYYLGGSTSCGAFTIGPYTYNPMYFQKINSEGDSVYAGSLGGRYGSVYSMSLSNDGYIIATAVENNFGGYKKVHIFTADTNGIVFRTDTLFEPMGQPFPRKSITGKDGCTFVVGQTYYQSQNHFWFLRKPAWEAPPIPKTYNPGHPNCMAHRVEQLPGGRYLVSGTVGSRISSFEVDSSGEQISNYRQWWQDEDLVNLSYGSVTRIGRNRRLVKGSTADGRHYTGIYEASGTKLWGHVEAGGSFCGFANQDSTFVEYYSRKLPTTRQYFVRKYRFDSTLIWATPIHGYFPQGVNNGFAIRDMLYNLDSTESAVVVGMFNQGGATDASAFKVSGVGIPATAVAGPRVRNALPLLTPYPNPAQEQVHLGVPFGQATVGVYNMLGQQVLHSQLHHNQPLTIGQLPPGLYTLQAEVDGKPTTSKLWKRNP